jgi:hypothetical protein
MDLHWDYVALEEVAVAQEGGYSELVIIEISTTACKIFFFILGVGGFVAKVPRHRLSNVGSLPPNEDDSSCTPPTEMALPNPSLYTDERPKLKRMRKSRRPKLEETYTNVIQVLKSINARIT